MAAVLTVLACPRVQAMQAMPVSARTETLHYRLVLQIRREERRDCKVEAATMHPTSGEIMVSGTMAGMSMNGGT